MAKENNKNYFYTAKALLISAIIATVVCVINILIYKYYLVEITQPADFIFFATTFTTAAVTVYAIIAGFTILIAFTRYQELNNIISEEINCLGDVLDFTKYIQEQDYIKEQIIDNVRKYGVSVANDEWPNMVSGQPNQKTSVYLENIMDSINNINLANNKNSVVFELFVNRIKDLTTFRGNRLNKAKEPFPQLLVLILYVISIVFIVSVFYTLTPNLLFQSIFLTSVVFVTSLVIQVVEDLGNPYKPGIWHVSKEDYENIKTSIVTQAGTAKKLGKFV